MSYTPNIDEDFENAIRGGNNQRNQPKKQNVSYDDIDEILKIFNTPEYKAKQQQSVERSTRESEPLRIKNNYGTISHINTKALKQKKKRKLTPFAKGLIGAVVVGGLMLGIHNLPHQTNDEPIVIPDGYVQLLASEDVKTGDSVYSIASEYYDSQVYGSVYDDLNDYVEAIIDANNLPYNGKITPYDTLSIPVLVDVDNPCYQELKSLESQIAKIQEEAYWVDYTVQYGDSLSSIAAKASGTYGETISLVNQIMSKNNLENSLIYAGQNLKIVNPALGKLKVSFNEMQASLFESVKVADEQK